MEDIEISVFRNLFKTGEVPYNVTLKRVFERIKTGKSKAVIDKLRSCEDENVKRNIKNTLPSIMFSGIFTERRIAGLKHHVGLMVLDYDKFKTSEEMYKQKEFLTTLPFVVAAFISPSGDGVKAVIKIPECDAKTHEKINKQFAEDYKCENFDTSGSNVDRVCFESYDPDIYVNFNPKEIYNPKIIDEGFSVYEKVPLLPIDNEDEIIKLIMNFNWKKGYVEGQRNAFIFDLAGAFCEYGISETTAISYIQHNIINDDFGNRELEITVKSAYKSRVFNSKYFENNKKLNKIKLDLKNGKESVISKHGISNELYDEIKEGQENEDFWYFDEDKKGNITVKINTLQYKLFLEASGFKKYFPSDVLKPIFVRVISNKVEVTSKDKIKDFVLDYLLNLGEFDVWNKCANYQNIFTDEFLSMLETIELLMLNDKKEESYIAFNNGILKVTKDDCELMDYIDVDGYIWKSQIINRDFLPLPKYSNDYKKFILNISDNYPDPIECVIGYLLSTYKNKMNNKAIILNDEVISENPEGGTGKGVFIQGIKQIRKVSILDGKAFDDKKSFPYQTVTQETNVLVFDDVKKNFDFESKFSLVTEGLTLERKNKDAIKLSVEESPKLVISTNYAIKGEGNSHDRRRHELEFSQYYNGNKTPYDEFGRQLFDDWDIDDYKRFDNYMIYCLQKYLKNGLIKQDAKNIKLRKFIAETAMEFYEWIIDKNNLPINVRCDKAKYYDDFINEYQDFKKWLTRKKFNIWIRKYAIYNSFNYEDGNSNGQRWFCISNGEQPTIEDEALTDLPF